MKLKKSFFLSSLLLAIMFITGCEQGPTSSIEPVGSLPQLSKFSLPAEATLVSANFFINLAANNDQTINIHKVTAPWEETVVTWNNFGSAFDLTVEGSFTANLPLGYKSVNVFGLVDAWLNGTTPNYGLLLDQVDLNYPRAEYYSRENPAGIDYHPYLELVYSTSTGNVTVKIPAIADTYIYENDPDYNAGTSTVLFTGWLQANDKEKQSLLKFDLGPADCQTAYAKGPNAICFLDIPNKVGNNWGWTNYIAGPFTGTQSWPIYAGAGQCDETKGALVGTLDVTYDGTTVTLFYNIDSDYTLDETHLWIGNGMLPTKKGKYVSNPGGFNKNGQTYVTYNISAPFYIAAHSVVCGDY